MTLDSHEKVRFPTVLKALATQIDECTGPEDLDFYPLLRQVSFALQITEEELLQQGFRKAYRQLIEGI